MMTDKLAQDVIVLGLFAAYGFGMLLTTLIHKWRNRGQRPEAS